MIDLPEVDNYKQLFLDETEMMDVRAPVEFSQGAFPHTLNLPLMTDEERQAVGLKYKQLGQDKAIELGHELVTGKIKEQRVKNWSEFITKNPQGVLYCFRGGLRSKITQQWIYEQTNIEYPRVKGGYKALRRFLIDELEQNTSLINPVILGGRTGIGKTIHLNKIKSSIDLEGIFRHRGSVFGKHADPQPSQIDIENTLSIELLRLVDKNKLNILFEDEAPNIGSRNIPKELFAKMKTSPLILLEDSVDSRVEIIFDEYIVSSLKQYLEFHGTETGFNKWSDQLLDSLKRIERRLGGERFKQLNLIMRQAIQEQQSSNDSSSHREWIKSLLVDYYDPMYDYQLTKKTDRVVFQGSSKDVFDYLKNKCQII